MEFIEISPLHNTELARIIRNCLLEFNAAKPGTVFFDKTTDNLSDLFSAKGSCYFVVKENGEIFGGAGIFPTHNLPQYTCELVKLYLSPSARGKGIGKMLMKLCEKVAIENGYRQIYLETLPELNIAVPLYEKMGYNYLETPMGDSGHSGCNIWMLKKLEL